MAGVLAISSLRLQLRYFSLKHLAGQVYVQILVDQHSVLLLHVLQDLSISCLTELALLVDAISFLLKLLHLTLQPGSRETA